MVLDRDNMAARRVVIGAVAHAVGTLQCSKADSDQNLNEILVCS